MLALVAVSYLVAHFMATDTVPRNATVSGVAIGGMSIDEATQTLTDQLSPGDQASFVLVGERNQSVELSPADAGLSVDYQATVFKAGAGSTWDPRILVRVITGGGRTSPVVQADKPLLTSMIEGLEQDFTRDPANAALSLDAATVQTESMLRGTALNVDATASAVLKAYQQATQRPVDARDEAFEAQADLTVTDPDVTDEDAAPIAEQATAALLPVTVRTPEAEAELPAERIAEVMTFRVTDGELAMEIDYPTLYDNATEVREPLSTVLGKDATVELQAGQPTVVDSVDGRGIGKDEFVAELTEVIEDPAPRAIDLEIVDVPAAFTTEDAENLGIKEVIGEFTTYYPYDSYHNTNLGLAAAGINNELVKPGETFSLAKATGPRNESTGYVPGGVLVGDHIEYAVGGGVSQSATTTYNAAFFAGMTDVEHHPHTEYFSQYPPGREATVYEGVLDLQFRNDTPYGVLMEAFIDPATPEGRGSLTVRVWSTQYFDSVTASDPVLSNYTSGQDKVSTSPSCVAQSPAQGFDVNYQRILVLDGQTTTEDYFWRYSPINRIQCKQPEPKPAESPSPSPS
ncbi:VanW family protein [Propionimicrobium sp. PCR01-08-3]|uniref:VanW family protein n=1 Tax=Propionimicrobium sp. PCR01-08-3 TaxID=3052086 RepID=UPI00255CD6A4|nr:VanW family protein [Propionimicrobium sp. PCR01-08-3]WIY81806.1 VanW family protein [Propionimicrobium sp. PCR01-08-3]